MVKIGDPFSKARAELLGPDARLLKRKESALSPDLTGSDYDTNGDGLGDTRVSELRSKRVGEGDEAVKGKSMSIHVADRGNPPGNKDWRNEHIFCGWVPLDGRDPMITKIYRSHGGSDQDVFIREEWTDRNLDGKADRYSRQRAYRRPNHRDGDGYAVEETTATDTNFDGRFDDRRVYRTPE